MLEQNIQFTIQDENNHDITCFILATQNINDHEINILFNQTNDPNNTLRYGKVIKEGNKYRLLNNLTEQEITELKEQLNTNIYALAEEITSNQTEG